jgi:dihydrolipoamide dehydrogenase
MANQRAERQLIVVGGGPGGYVAAIKAAQAGLKVTLIEKKRLGGTCLNVGCMATKCLLKSAHSYLSCDEMARYGVTVDDAVFDIGRTVKYKNAVVDRLVGGISGLLAKNRVEVITGAANFVDDGTVEADGVQYTFQNLIIAAGSDVAKPPIPGLEEAGVLYSHDALSIDHVPKSIVIIGGGVVAMEFAEFFNCIGSEVTVIEMMPRLIPGMDPELGDMVQRFMAKKGVTVYTGAKVTGIERGRVTFEQAGAAKTVQAGDILVAIGRVPNLTALKLENTGIKHSASGIEVDPYLQTSVPGIYAIGDAIPTTQLAAVASDEGAIAVANILGGKKKMDYGRVPACVFIEPQIASVGMTESEAREKGIDIRVGKFPMLASGRSMVENVSDGFVKIVARANTEQVLGVQLVAPYATELVSLCSLAISMEATLEELIENFYPHPTIGEAIKEAAMAARGKAVHF